MLNFKIILLILFLFILPIVIAEPSPNLILNVNQLDDLDHIKTTQNLVLLSEVFNLGEMSNFDIFVYYYIYDSNDNKVFEEHETAAIETRASFVKKIRAPSVSGNYTAKVSIFYLGEEMTNSSFDFKTVDESSITGAAINDIEAQLNPIKFGFIFFMLLSLILIIYIIIDKKINK